MRQHFPPKLSGSSPITVAMALATRLESPVVQGVTPSGPVNRGVQLTLPNVLSSTGTRGARSSHMARSA
eukprot:5312179-Pleurochrysis_carterae.AAC.1